MSKAEETLANNDSVFSGFVLDPEKCRGLSIGEKRELVHEIVQWSRNAPELLSSFTRRELLEIICAEMGKERKYTGYTKYQMIDHLLKLVYQKVAPMNVRMGMKRKWQKEPPLHPVTNSNHSPGQNPKDVPLKVQLCQNVACQAALDTEEPFCNRCSCCICHQYDENKDPSLWLTCGADSVNDKDFCRVSCHLKCALEDERAGMVKISGKRRLDGSYCCIYCGKINGTMRTWRKQLLIAKETRRVDALCLRISLAHKILKGTVQYKDAQKIVETALMVLEHEVGPLNLLCTKIARGIVNRLSCGSEIQKLCASAVEAFDSMSSEHDYLDQNRDPACFSILFEESSATSVTIVLKYANHLLDDLLGCRLWHRKSTVENYPKTPTFFTLKPEKRFKIIDLDPSTEYFYKFSLFSHRGTLGVHEATWTTPPFGTISVAPQDDEHEEEGITIKHHSDDTRIEESSSLVDVSKNINQGLRSAPPPTETDSLTSHASVSPSTPCKSIGTREVPTHKGCKRREEESEYEYSVRVVKWLEHEGHIDEDFRVKFLTWFSLKATRQERRVVTVFVDAFIDDPPSLAGQLLHTFMDEISGDSKPIPCHESCTKLRF